MKLDRLTPMLWVDDVEATIRYYVNTLSFTELNYSAADGWAIIEKDSVKMMFSLPNSHVQYQKPNLTGSLYFNTDNVEGWWEKLKDISDIIYPMELFDYGMKEFAIRDCNGYILQFGQTMET